MQQHVRHCCAGVMWTLPFAWLRVRVPPQTLKEELVDIKRQQNALNFREHQIRESIRHLEHASDAIPHTRSQHYDMHAKTDSYVP